ncbi:MAG: D-alanyl-D-alanine carboxypeptidase, partial [Firmicutes bacterium]|nr:D-alanyl-D-alanine carboxypeptidase [Bacillota bacterium]
MKKKSKKFNSLIIFLIIYTIFVNSVTIVSAQPEDEIISEGSEDEIASEGTEPEEEASEEIVSEESTEEISTENAGNSDDTGKSDKAPTIVAQSAILIDADTGFILYDKDCHRKSYPASTTKSMTALLAIENTEKTDIITHSDYAINETPWDSSKIYAEVGEKLTMEQALYAVLLASANEVCMAIAEHIDGSVDKFVERMNKKAEELGCKDTHFNNPHGYHDEQHYTSAYDMSLIFKEAIKYPDFLKYISTDYYSIPQTKTNKAHELYNTNQLIWEDSVYYYPECVGSKTGYTNEAGNTLVTYAKKDGVNLISVVMRDEGFNIYSDTKTLMEYGFSLYSSPVTIYNADQFYGQAEVQEHYTYNEEERMRELGEVSLYVEKDLEMRLPSSIDTSKITKRISFEKTAEAPVNKGDKFGEIVFTYEEYPIGVCDIVSRDAVERVPEEVFQSEDKRSDIIDIIILIVISVFCVSAVILIFLFIVRYREMKN